MKNDPFGTMWNSVQMILDMNRGICESPDSVSLILDFANYENRKGIAVRDKTFSSFSFPLLITSVRLVWIRRSISVVPDRHGTVSETNPNTDNISPKKKCLRLVQVRVGINIGIFWDLSDLRSNSLGDYYWSKRFDFYFFKWVKTDFGEKLSKI